MSISNPMHILPRLLRDWRTAVSPSPPALHLGLPIASRRVPRLTSTHLLFVVIVLIPTLLTAAYSFLIAADRYTSEANFIVRGVANQQIMGLGALFRTFGISRAEDDSYAVLNFIQSRDAVHEMEARLPLRDFFSRREADVLSRFPYFWRNRSFESLFDYYLSHITVVPNSSTGITFLRVAAFRGEDAQAIAITLLRLAEELVNRMNTRAQRDALAHAENELREAESRVMATQAAVTAFRNRELLIDPSSNSAKVVDVIAQLSANLADTQTQFNQTIVTAPSNPAIDGLKARMAALQSEIANERGKLAGGEDALAAKMSTYERLLLDRQFADSGLAAASSAMEIARQEARRKQIYIETISAPHAPDESTEPRRFRNTMTILVFSSAIFAMTWFLTSAVKEHTYA